MKVYHYDRKPCKEKSKICFLSCYTGIDKLQQKNKVACTLNVLGLHIIPCFYCLVVVHRHRNIVKIDQNGLYQTFCEVVYYMQLEGIEYRRCNESALLLRRKKIPCSLTVWRLLDVRLSVQLKNDSMDLQKTSWISIHHELWRQN